MHRRGGRYPTAPQKSPYLVCPVTSVREAGTTGTATTGQDLAAVGGSHTLAEAVNLAALTLFGLIGTLHFQYTSCTHSDGSRPNGRPSTTMPAKGGTVDMKELSRMEKRK